MTRPIAVHTAGLSRCFGGIEALESLDLEVGAGEVVCLCGPNGAGKSTTLRLLAGLLRPNAGEAHVAGISVAADPRGVRGKVSLLPEQVRLYPYLTGLENLAYLAALAGATGDKVGMLDTLSAVGLSSADAGRRASSYSKGMRQRVVLALTRLRQCPVLLLDEPTSGLDPLAVDDLVTLIESERARGVATVLVTHDLWFARRVADRIAFLARGRLQALVRAEEATGLEALFLASVSPPPRAAVTTNDQESVS